MITIQKPGKEDVVGMQEVFYQAWLVTYPNKEAGITIEDIEEKFKHRLEPEVLAKRTDAILCESANQLFLVAKDDDKVVGVCRVEKKEDYNKLIAIYVLPSHHRMGIGSMMWEKVKEFFGDEKDAIVEVAIYNTQAINFYKKLGFVDTGKRFSEEAHKMPISGSYIPEMQMIIKAK